MQAWRELSLMGIIQEYLEWRYAANIPIRDIRPVALKLLRLPSIADIGIAALEALLEPIEALQGRSVREAVGHDATRRLLLEAVVADGGRPC